MTIVLSLAASLAYGLSDFVGGLVSRRASAWAVAVISQVMATIGIGLVAVIVGGSPTAADLAWGALGGLGAGIGTGILYRGLGGGRMSVVAPLSAVGAALLPVAVGIATGERPSTATWVGVIVAFPAIWLVARGTEHDEVLGEAKEDCRPQSQDVIDGLGAGAGFGLLFVALGQVPHDAGLAPLAVMDFSAVVVLTIAALALGESLRLPTPVTGYAALAGALGAAATALFLLATQHGLLTVASVLTSLYPATTVILAAVVLHEHISRWQGIGLGFAGVAIGLVAAG
ncbi:MAG TPA: EamA family transporter [Nocardioidaceae bacterium]|nr:EamA family transporter [Nocardioidaceae bacterium]